MTLSTGKWVSVFETSQCLLLQGPAVEVVVGGIRDCVRNVGNQLLADTASHPRKHGS